MNVSSLLLCSLVLALFTLQVRAGPGKQALTVGFDDRYAVDGVIILPYAELREPFSAYFDSRRNRSRIDYYGDLVQTFQRGDQLISEGDDEVIGISYKLAYNVDRHGFPHRVCFQINGSDVNPVTAQAALPDLTGFTYSNKEPCPEFGSEARGQEICELWKLETAFGDKKNKYRFWLKRGKLGRAIPVHYNMEGFNSLFGSHYDKYEVSYKNYRLQLDDSVFDVPENLTCTSFPGPGAGQPSHLHNPMAEFMNDEQTREGLVDKTFDHFKKRHSKQYQNETEEERRKAHFRHNHRFIESNNRKNLHYKLKVNHLADWSMDEFRLLRGRLFSNVKYNGGHPFEKPKMSRPDNLDWRLHGAVTPVKDQAICGSCWSFGTVGTIEGVNFVKTGHLIKLSEQQLIDCSWNEGDNGCDGGEDFRAYQYIMKVGGLAASEDYGDYLGQDGKCHDRKVGKAIKLAGFVNVTSYDPEALELALFKHGPVTVAIDASQRTFSFYSNGVYYDPECGNQPDDLDHQVLAVGYGTLYGQRYWLVKNSWSTYWGNDGYILMAQRDNNCGVLTSPTYPIIV